MSDKYSKKGQPFLQVLTAFLHPFTAFLKSVVAGFDTQYMMVLECPVGCDSASLQNLQGSIKTTVPEGHI